MSRKLEQEVKFAYPDLPALEKKLVELGARLKQPRTFERNLRFDTEARDLLTTFQVLRLRQDTQTRLTYKGPSDIDAEVNARQEMEVTVSDFQTAKDILEALGFEVSIIYEKHRSAFMLEDVEVSLDEMPFGNYIELEGPDTESIREAANKLGLHWDDRIVLGYMNMFQIIKERLMLPFRDLTFGNFADVDLTPGDLDFKDIRLA